MNQNNQKNDEKLHSIFEHELAISQNFPFRNVFISEPFKGYLFNEFIVSELKPCAWLYREQFYSQNEYEKIIRKINAEIPVYDCSEAVMAPTLCISEPEVDLRRIQEEFFEKVNKNILDLQFFCPDIMKTPIAIILLQIDKAFEFFKNPNFNEDKQELYVEIIIEALNQISHIDLQNRIIEELRSDNLNFKVIGMDDGGISSNNWQKRKFEFDHLIKNDLTGRKHDIHKKNARNRNTPRKIVDANMTLKTILYEELYQEARNYYKAKIDKGKMKGAQYGQLIREFAKKNWIKPDYKSLSPSQMKMLILNEFNESVSTETARKNPKGNEFDDLPKKTIRQFPM